MKTLIINGSPHLKGNTHTLIDILVNNISGEYKIIDAYYTNISPCTDCGYCKKNEGCAKKDDMTTVYEHIDECDNIVIASPVYFGELTPPVLCIGSRLQANYCSINFLKNNKSQNPKKYGIILTGGGSSGNCVSAVKTAIILLKQMGKGEIFNPVYSLHTDLIPASEDKAAIENVLKLAGFFNSNKI